VNDVYTDYLKMGSPATLTREQVQALAERNNGQPVSTMRVKVNTSGVLSRNVSMRENDVYFVTLLPIR